MPEPQFWSSLNDALTTGQRRAFNEWRKSTLDLLGELTERYEKLISASVVPETRAGETSYFGKLLKEMTAKVKELPPLEASGDEFAQIRTNVLDLCACLAAFNPNVDPMGRIGAASVLAGQLKAQLRTLTDRRSGPLDPAPRGEERASAVAPPLVVHDVTPPAPARPADDDDGRSIRPLIKDVKAKVDEILADLADPNRSGYPLLDNGRWSFDAALTLGLVQGCLAQCRAFAPAGGSFQGTFDAIGNLIDRVSRHRLNQSFNPDRWHLLAATVLSDAQATLQELLDVDPAETPSLARSA